MNNNFYDCAIWWDGEKTLYVVDEETKDCFLAHLDDVLVFDKSFDLTINLLKNPTQEAYDETRIYLALDTEQEFTYKDFNELILTEDGFLNSGYTSLDDDDLIKMRDEVAQNMAKELNLDNHTSLTPENMYYELRKIGRHWLFHEFN